MAKRLALKTKPTVTVPAKLTPGASRWMLLTCEQGHLIRNIAYGDWTDARRQYERPGATVECARCADG